MAPPAPGLAAVLWAAAALLGVATPARGAALRGSSTVMRADVGMAPMMLDAVESLKHEWLRNDAADEAIQGGGRPLQKSELARQGGEAAWRLQRAGRLADANNDTLLTAEEMRDFAQSLSHRQRWEEAAAALRRLDVDKSGDVSLAELRAATGSVLNADLLEHQERRFRAADADGNGRLDQQQLLGFAHPEVNDAIFRVELEHQFAAFDTDRDGWVDVEEYGHNGRARDDGFSEEEALEDFRLHDADGDGRLARAEFGRLLAGHDLLADSIRKAIAAGDSDGDGQLHIDRELPGRLQLLLASEFVEDFLLHEYVQNRSSRSEL